jgi:hypothetical protein
MTERCGLRLSGRANDHAHLWHGERPSEVRCAFQDCGAKPSKADIERVRFDVAQRRDMRQTIEMTHERPDARP